MTDHDRLRILANQGDPIAIGELYREAKRRGEAVVCASTDSQSLTAPPASRAVSWVVAPPPRCSPPWAYPECRLDVGEPQRGASAEQLRRVFDLSEDQLRTLWFMAEG